MPGPPYGDWAALVMLAVLSAVSKVVGRGYPQAKRIIDAGESLLFSGRAAEARGKRDPLERGGVACRIEPG